MPKQASEPFPDALLEQLADLAHQSWSEWMRYLFENGVQEDDGCFAIPPGKVERWRRQMHTPYADLPEHEQENNREEARRYLRALFPPTAEVEK